MIKPALCPNNRGRYMTYRAALEKTVPIGFLALFSLPHRG
jgi:hypothetical protein